jgi:hypothetical protein
MSNAYRVALVAGGLEAQRTRHRPMSPDAIALEARQLAADGLTAVDVADALGIHPDVVLRLVAGIAP